MDGPKQKNTVKISAKVQAILLPYNILPSYSSYPILNLPPSQQPLSACHLDVLEKRWGQAISFELQPKKQADKAANFKLV